MSDFRREILMEHRDRLLDEMAALSNQVAGLDMALAILANEAAQGIEARSATTEGRGPEDESPVAESDAPRPYRD